MLHSGFMPNAGLRGLSKKLRHVVERAKADGINVLTEVEVVVLAICVELGALQCVGEPLESNILDSCYWQHILSR